MSLGEFATRTRPAALVLVALAASVPLAGGQDKAPRRPPEPFRVFVYASDPADASLRAWIEEALPMVQERVERRKRWFQIADSAETADLTLRLVNYRTGQHWNPQWNPSVWYGLRDSRGREFHFLDAVVQGGGGRTRLSGLDERPLNMGPSVRNAASHLVEELEAFCRENYAALSELRVRAGTSERKDSGMPRPKSTSGPGY